MSVYPLPNTSEDLFGQIAFVTGATSGLGWRFARVLAKAGAKVIATGRREERLAELKEVIEGEGGQLFPYPLDMTNADDIQSVVARATEEVGLITILVNNAGIPDAQHAHKMSVDLIDRVFDTNLRGPFILSCEVAKRLIAAESPGRMINISSRGGFSYSGGGAALYSVTKAGIARMSDVLAVGRSSSGKLAPTASGITLESRRSITSLMGGSASRRRKSKQPTAQQHRQ